MIKQLIKYGLITFLSYVFLASATYVLVEILSFPSDLAYLIALTLTYIGVFVAQLKYIFKTVFSRKKMVKYIIVIIIFWSFNNLFFNFLTKVFLMHYFLAVVLNIVLLGFFRFYIQRNFVFKDKQI